MFPTTVWTHIQRAGAEDAEALDRFARAYHGPVLRFIEGRGVAPGDAEDVCQEVFVRLLRGKGVQRNLWFKLADSRFWKYRQPGRSYGARF